MDQKKGVDYQVTEFHTQKGCIQCCDSLTHMEQHMRDESCALIFDQSATCPPQEKGLPGQERTQRCQPVPRSLFAVMSNPETYWISHN